MSAVSRGRRVGGVAVSLVLVAVALAATLAALTGAGSSLPVPPTAVVADSLIRPGETHFKHLWQLTFGGQNAEAYWSENGDQLIWQSTRDDWPCDQEYVMDLRTGHVTRVSNGKGRTTCGYFYDHDERVFFASTHLGGDSCPPMPDYSHGYVWAVTPSYDIFTARPDGSDLRRLTDTPGYDAEGTLSVDGKWIVFTSMRDGDLELYKMHPDGTGLMRLTHELGYDGGAYFSKDGKWICYRGHHPTDPKDVAEYKDLLSQSLVRPLEMDLWVMRSDGSDKRQITHKAGASFAPYFTPDGKSLIFSSNFENPTSRNFDLYLVPVAGGEPQPVTRDPSFDGFPMFNANGKWLVFESNRNGTQPHETNIFLAEWK